MIFNIPMTVLKWLVDAYVSLMNTTASAMPSWYSVGMNYVFSASKTVDLFLPMYPHPELSGPVAVFGLVNVLGFIATAVVVGVVAILFYFMVKLILRVLPWNTQQ